MPKQIKFLSDIELPKGLPVFYQGIKVGKVSGSNVTPAEIEITAEIHDIRLLDAISHGLGDRENISIGLKIEDK